MPSSSMPTDTWMNPTDLCNGALGHLGADEIEDVTNDSSTAGLACRRFYTQVFQDLLRAYQWNWATVWQYLQAVTVNTQGWPDNNQAWQFVYRLPADNMFFRRIWNGHYTDDKYNYIPYVLGSDQEGRLLYTNFGDPANPPSFTPLAQYTSMNPPFAIIPPDFKMGFSLTLAGWIAPKVKQGNSELRMECLQLAGMKMKDAMSADLNEIMPPKDFISSLQKVRGGLGSGGIRRIGPGNWQPFAKNYNV